LIFSKSTFPLLNGVTSAVYSPFSSIILIPLFFYNEAREVF
jgi:hypothetical protein